MAIKSPEELTKLLRNEKTVSSERFGDFLIAPVNLLQLFQEKDDYISLLKDDPAKFSSILRQKILSPSKETIRAVLLDGLIEPKVSQIQTPGRLWVDDVLRSGELCLFLFSEIVGFSHEEESKPHAP